MNEEQNENTAFVPGDAQQEMKQVEELRESIDSLVQIITEQVVKEEEEKIEALELQAKEEAEAKALAEEQAKLDAENQQLVEEQVQAETATVEDFRENLMIELKTLNENVQKYEALSEAIIEHQKVEMELYNVMYFASIAVIVTVCIMPSIWIVKQFKNMLSSFI